MVTPFDVMEPVNLGGSTVERATLHTAFLRKAGDVIPEIVRCVATGALTRLASTSASDDGLVEGRVAGGALHLVGALRLHRVGFADRAEVSLGHVIPMFGCRADVPSYAVLVSIRTYGT